MLGMLAVVPASHAAQTTLSIRITPRAAALIAALHHGVAPVPALARVPQPGSATALKPLPVVGPNRRDHQANRSDSL
jgi:hypothetical protein